MCPTVEISQHHNKSSMFTEKCWWRPGVEASCSAHVQYLKPFRCLKMFDMKNVHRAFLFIHLSCDLCFISNVIRISSP